MTEAPMGVAKVGMTEAPTGAASAGVMVTKMVPSSLATTASGKEVARSLANAL
jgi:hypothetical protein